MISQPRETTKAGCGAEICQARDNNNATIREYYPEGEFVPGGSPGALFYGIDQIGSVRRVFEDVSTAPAFNYDPFGNFLQAGPPVADFGFAGMLYNADSGLYLTQYRAYDPTVGRWISRDPLYAGMPLGFVDIREATNLYAYVRNSPVNYVDPRGTNPLIGVGAGVGTIAMPGIGTVAGGIVGGVVGYFVFDAVLNSTAENPPQLPEDITGHNPRPSSGKTTNTDLPPEEFGDVVDRLTGGITQEGEGGVRVCPNGVQIRPEVPGVKGPRIDIPAFGGRPPETIHFPPGTPWPWPE